MNINVYRRNVKYKNGLLVGWDQVSMLTPIDFYIKFEELAKKAHGDKFVKDKLLQITHFQAGSIGKWWLKFGLARKIFGKIGKDNLESTGLGKINLMSFTGGSVRIEVSSNAAKHILKVNGKSKKTVCNYYSSLVSGPITGMFGLKPANEIKCMAKGDDVCVFESEK